MNAVYKLIFNVSTGTWAVASELTASRGKKNRTRLASAMAVALTLPAGAAMAADSPEALQCDINETISEDGLRCKASARTSVASGGIGTMATATQLADLISFGSSAAGVGANASATGALSTAIGYSSIAGAQSVALGGGAEATAVNSVGIGMRASARGGQAVALGNRAASSGVNAVAIGNRGTATADNSVAIGVSSEATADNSVAIGASSDATGGRALSFGVFSKALGISSVAIGDQSNAATRSSVAIGTESNATGDRAIAIGPGAAAIGNSSAALGRFARVEANATNSVALGHNSVATDADTVSVGNTAETDRVTRRIVNMAAGTANTDAVNIAQLKPVVDALGGGATINTTTGAVTGPTYNIGGADRSTVGDALTNLDGRLKDSGLSDDDGSTIAAVTYDRNADKTPNYRQVTLGNGSGTVQLKNVAAGTEGTDAVNLDQLTTAVANVAPAANPYIGGTGEGVAASATSQGSVALGLGSVANNLNTVSVGNASTGLVRRITNVADGSNRSDAATVGQLNDLVTGTTMSTQNSINEVNNKIAALSDMGIQAAVDDAFLKIDSSAGSAQATVGADTSAVAIGSGATATGSFSAAIGADARATGNQAVAIGGDAHATAAGALAMGSADATGTNAVALGNGVIAAGNNAVASGFNARAAGTNAVASGNTASAAAANAIAIGATATIAEEATNSVALGRGAQVTATASNAVALGANSSATRANTVSVGTAAANRQVVNVGAGSQDTDAVNVSQLKDIASAIGGGTGVAADGSITAPTFNVGDTDFHNVGEALDNIDGRTSVNTDAITTINTSFTTLQGDVNNLLQGTAGLVQYDATANANAGGVTVAKDLAGTTVDFTGKGADDAAIQRRLLGVAAGTADTDAVNFGQLKGTAKSVADALGGTSTVNADGTVSAPSYSVADTAYHDVGRAIGAIDTSLTGAKGDLTNLTEIVNNLSAGSAGLVVYDEENKKLTVAADRDATTFDFAGEDAAGNAIDRKLSSVAAGTANTDAANVGQVRGIASAIGGGAAVAADGTITAPTFNVGDTDFHNVGEALGNIDGRTKANTGAISTINTSVTSLQGDVNNLLQGTAGLVQYDATANANAGGVTVAKDLAGTTVDFRGKNAENAAINRRLTGVAAGTADTDAVNLGQLNARVANPYFAGAGEGTPASAASNGSVALGIGSVANGLNTVSVGNAASGLVRRITNVADGQANSDAATIGQVNDLVVGVTTTTTNALNEFNNKISSMSAGTLAAVDDAYLKIDAGAGSSEASVAADTSAVAIGSGANATGSFSAAIGADAQATGTQAVAIGGDAKATATGALAMGTAQASAVNSVSLGNGTIASGNYAVASGFNARAAGTNAIALGNTANAASENAIAIGSASSVNTAATGSIALGRGANVAAAALNSVALGAGSAADRAHTVSVGSATQQRQITNVAAGTADTDAVNLTQLRAYVSENGGGAANPLAVSYTNTDRDSITLGNADAETGTKISNVAAGAVSATSSDAINGKQLYDTADSVAKALGGGATVGTDGKVTEPSYVIGDTTHHDVGTAIGAVNTTITNLTNGSIGLVQYDATANANAGGLTVAKDLAGTTVDFSGTSQGATVSRRLTGVAAGIADTNAVNVFQLKGIASAIGGGAAVGADGTITAPSFSIGDNTYNNVGQALTNIDGRTTANTTNIQNLTTRVDQIGEGGAADPLAVAYTDADKGEIALAGEEGTTISNVKAGAVTATSMDAINGAQLHGTATSVATALGGGSVVNTDGTVSAPKYTIGDGDYANVGDAFDAVDTSLTGLDGRLTTTEGDVTNLSTIVNNLSNGTAGLVTIDATTSNVQVAKDVGGTVVDMEGTEGKRRVSGVANGTQADDAVTIAQLRAAGAIDPVSGQTLSVLTYDGDDLARATLGGTNGTVIANLGNGLVAAGSREAINGGQLFEVKADWEARFNGLDGRVGTIEQGISDGTIGSGGGNGGGDSGLVGPGAGDRSVVIGEGSTATGNDSVAIGSGSTADRDREVSVGAAGNERVISNVATGTRPTDAVNVQQMEDRFTAERDWTNGRFQAVDKRIDRMGAISAAYAGMAINTAGLEGEHRVGAGIGQQNGRSALAVGYQRVLGEKKNISVSLGGAFSGSDKSMSAGAGFSW